MVYKLKDISEEVLTAVLGERKKDAPPRSPTKDMLLLLLLVGGISISLTVAPSIVVASGAIATLLNKERQSKKFERSFHYLKHQKLMRVRRSNKEWELILTPKGKERAETYWVQNLTLPKKKRWDGTWYVIVFDIPHTQRGKRDALRRFIKRHDCYPLQKSVWLYPFDCRQEIAELRELLDLEDAWLQVIVASDVDDDRRVRKHFGIV